MIINVHLISGQFFLIGKTYHVIAFFFISGLIHGLKEKWKTQSINSFVKQRAERLLYPYCTLSLCYLVFRLLLNIIRGDVWINNIIVDASINFVLMRGIGTLWFLPILFGGEILFFQAKRMRFCDSYLIIGGIFFIVIASILDNYGICGSSLYGNFTTYGVLVNIPLSILLASIIAAFFIDCGYVVIKKFPCILKSDKYHNIYIIIFACFLSYYIDYCLLDSFTGDLHKLKIGSPLIYIVSSVCGLIFVISISLLIVLYMPRVTKMLSYFGKNSLIIMTTHSEYMINSMVYLLIINVLEYAHLSCNMRCISLISLFLILLIENAIIYLINNSKLRFLYLIPDKFKNRYINN